MEAVFIFIFASSVWPRRNPDGGIAADVAACRGNRRRSCLGRHAIPRDVSHFLTRAGLLVQQPLPLAAAHPASGHSAVSCIIPGVGSRGGLAIAEPNPPVSCRDSWNRPLPASHAWRAQCCIAGADVASDGTPVRGGRSVDHSGTARGGIAARRRRAVNAGGGCGWECDNPKQTRRFCYGPFNIRKPENEEFDPS